MGVRLPELSANEFVHRLSAFGDFELLPTAATAMWAHYEELRRWSERLSLIGRGTAKEVVPRHYVESLSALALLGSCLRVVDIGSGAGFPGLIIAAARPALEVWLVEARYRKAVFLQTATRKASLSCRVLNARVGASLPEGFPQDVDVVTVRAVRLGADEWSAVTARMGEDGRILRWVGRATIATPHGFVVRRRKKIEGTSRAIEELVRKG